VLGPASALFGRQNALGVNLGLELGQERPAGLGSPGGAVGLSGPLFVRADLGA
jgi:hypothetical protein